MTLEEARLTTPAILALEDGSVFRGVAIGAPGTTVGEMVFNTAMTGYQEIATNPAHVRQLVALTCPHIGNVGTNADDDESAATAAGLIVRSGAMVASSFRSQEPLGDWLVRRGIVAIAELDTRRLTRLLREGGRQYGCIATGPELDEQAAVARARARAGETEVEAIAAVSTVQPYDWTEGSWDLKRGFFRPDPAQQPWHVVVYDFGCTRSSLRRLVDLGCRLTVVPARTTAESVLAMNPDGVFLSSGPDGARHCSDGVAAVGELLEAGMPLLGLGVGLQLLALASGAQLVRLDSGHHGDNYPVRDLERGTVAMTRQFNDSVVADEGLPEALQITHRSGFDDSIQGLRHRRCPALGIQGLPSPGEASGGAPSPLEQFVELMKSRSNPSSGER